MNGTTICKLYDHIQERLTKKRMEHTRGVLSVANALAKQYGVDAEKAECSALCHDMARCISSLELEFYVREFGLDPRYSSSIELSHAKIAAELLKRVWGITDTDILNAVAYHTTGRRGMSMLEKIIYLADAIEPARDYSGVERLRELAYKDINKACLEVINNCIEDLNRKGSIIDKDTLEAREYLLAEERRADEQ